MGMVFGRRCPYKDDAHKQTLQGVFALDWHHTGSPGKTIHHSAPEIHHSVPEIHHSAPGFYHLLLSPCYV